MSAAVASTNRTGEASAALITEYESMAREGRLGQPPPSFDKWRLSLLSSTDVIRALQRQLAANASPQPNVRPQPDIEDALRSQITARQGGAGPGPFDAVFDLDPPARARSLAEQAHLVLFASERYPKGTGAMPPSLRELFETSLYAVSDQTTARLEKLADRYFAAIDKLVLLADAATPDVVDSVERSRKDLRDAALGHWLLLQTWEPRHGADLSAQQSRVAKLYALVDSIHRRTGGDRFDGPEPSGRSPAPGKGPPDRGGGPGAPAQWTDMPPPGGGSPIRTLLIHPGAAKAMSRAERTLAQLETNLKPHLEIIEAAASLPEVRTARWINTAMGRRSVSETEFRNERSAFASMGVDAGKRRLADDNEEDWDTFRKLDKEGKKDGIYNFETEVRDYDKFDGIGGGIHLGATAKPEGAPLPAGYVLRYDARSEQLMLVAPSWDPGLEMLRLGYRIDASTLKALHRYVASGNNLAVSIGWSGSRLDLDSSWNAVFLDRSLVDTKIGQDLVLADSIPWKLGLARLPNGAINPGHSEMCKAFERYESDARTNQEATLSAIGALLAKAPPQAVLDRVLNDIFDKAKADPNNSGPALSVKDLRRGVIAEVQSNLQGGGITPARAVWLAAHSFRTLEPDISPRTLRDIRGDLGIPASSMSDDALQQALRIRSLLPNVTLAVLWDNDAALEFGSELRIKGGLHWRYASRRILVTDKDIKTSTDSGNQVEELMELTGKVNSLLSSGRLEAAYQPLARVRRHAEVAGLLRWAMKNKSTVAVDFSQLSRTASYDAKRTPTPDRIKQDDGSRKSPPCQQ